MGLINFFYHYFTALRFNYSNYDRVVGIQNRRLRSLLRHAVEYSDLYKTKFKGIDIEHCRISELPVITKSEMMNNFNHLVTDPRLKLEEIQEWTSEVKNFGKLYLNRFIPIPSSGSTGEHALVVYDRKAADIIQASLLARHPMETEHSLYERTKCLASYLSRKQNPHCYYDSTSWKRCILREKRTGISPTFRKTEVFINA